MVKYCFIILHYLTIEDTIACVNSIKSLEINCEQVSIVIVDNASSNGTGKVISEKYKNERNTNSFHKKRGLLRLFSMLRDMSEISYRNERR